MVLLVCRFCPFLLIVQQPSKISLVSTVFDRISVLFVDIEQEKEHNGHLWHKKSGRTIHMTYPLKLAVAAIAVCHRFTPSTNERIPNFLISSTWTTTFQPLLQTTVYRLPETIEFITLRHSNPPWDDKSGRYCRWCCRHTIQHTTDQHQISSQLNLMDHFPHTVALHN